MLNYHTWRIRGSLEWISHFLPLAWRPIDEMIGHISLFTKPCLLAYTVSYLTEFETATHGSLETWPHNGSLITVPIVRCLIHPSRHILIIHSQRWGLMKPQTGGWAYTVPLSIFRRNSHNDPKVNHPRFFIFRRYFNTHWPNSITQNTLSH